MKFSNITFLLSLFASASAAAVFGTVIVPLKNNIHHYNHINYTLAF